MFGLHNLVVAELVGLVRLELDVFNLEHVHPLSAPADIESGELKLCPVLQDLLEFVVQAIRDLFDELFTKTDHSFSRFGNLSLS